MAQNKKKSPAKKLSPDELLRAQLVELLKGGNAHVGFLDAFSDFTQRDILEFSRNPKHVSPEFPVGYWPKTPVPRDDSAWKRSMQSFQWDLRAMIRLVSSRRVDLHAPFPWGSGQTLLREALLLADHNAYHLAQIVDLRRALGIWPES